MRKRTLRPLLSFAIAAVALSSVASCTDPPIYLPPEQAGAPAGALEGTVTYSGPLPCTKGGHVVGAAVLEVFDVRLLPPPEGLGTTATSLGAVAGDKLFAGVANRLTYKPDGSLWCPEPGGETVDVSAPWQIAPLEGAEYQVRGFYDYDGDFDPILSVFKFPTQGDIAGGAIENIKEILVDPTKAPVFRRIAVGDPQPDGTFKIPDLGVIVNGVTVTFALPLPLEPPLFYAKEVFYSTNACKNGAVVPAQAANTDPNKATMPADYTLPVFNATDPAGTQDSLIRMGLGAGVAKAEVDTAVLPPFNFPVKSPPPRFAFKWQDVNADGMLSLTSDHVPDSSIIPSLFPFSIFSKLDDDQGLLFAQTAPVVILQGLTMYKDLPTTAFFAAGTSQVDTEVVIGVRPAVLCLDPEDFSKPATLVLTHKTDCGGNPLLTSELATKAALKKQFNRDIEIKEGCLPQGKFAINLIYDTGQAWTVPNEAGVCQPLEPPYAGGTMCGDSKTKAHRPVLKSQGVFLTIGEPDDAAYCTSHPTPAECLPPPKKKTE